MASHRGKLGDVLEGEWKGGNDCRRVAGDGMRGIKRGINSVGRCRQFELGYVRGGGPDIEGIGARG
jgi:hypothetical protein